MYVKKPCFEEIVPKGNTIYVLGDKLECEKGIFSAGSKVLLVKSMESTADQICYKVITSNHEDNLIINKPTPDIKSLAKFEDWCVNTFVAKNNLSSSYRKQYIKRKRMKFSVPAVIIGIIMYIFSVLMQVSFTNVGLKECMEISFVSIFGLVAFILVIFLCEGFPIWEDFISKDKLRKECLMAIGL